MLTLRTLKLYENTASPRRFSRVRVLDAQGGGALGATVALTAGGVTRRDFVRVTEGFRGQVPTDLHFGLGGHDVIEQLEVQWPDGGNAVWRNLPVDVRLTVTAASADVDAEPLPRWPDGTRPLLTGEPSPSVVAERLAGGTAALGGGRPTVVNFWAPWCAPCNVELPVLVRLAERYEGNIDFVGVSVERADLEAVRQSIEKFQIRYPQFLASASVMEQFFGEEEAAALPSTYVFDADGQLRRLFRGAVTEADLDGLLASFGDEGESEEKLRLLAETYFAANDFARAVTYYERLTQLEPTNRHEIGMAWERRRAADRAKLAEARRALAAHRRQP